MKNIIPEIIGKYLDTKIIGNSKKYLVPISIDGGYHNNNCVIGFPETIIAKLPSMLKRKSPLNLDSHPNLTRS